ncbi:MAG: GNAT family N-acetyltransferase [Planctomycetes bacterium]|nr:GNAT family N-acetyltransferase [Planctomycetota bacterium]
MTTTNKQTVSAVHAKVYTDFEQLQPIQQEWDTFVESVSGDIFMTFDWCQIWWKYYGGNRDLKVFIFRCNTELVGIIPLFFEKLWLGPVFVKAGKIVGSDYTLSQFSIPIDSEHIKAVVDNFCDLISKEHWDILHIGPIAGLYGDYDDLKNAFNQSPCGSISVVSEIKGVQTYFELFDSWETQLSNLSKKQRKNIGRSYRSMCETTKDKSLSINSQLVTSQDFEKTFREFVRAHQSHWREMGKAGHFGDWPNAQLFHHEVATAQLKHHRLRLLRIDLGELCLGHKYGYKFGDKYFSLLNSQSTISNLQKFGLGRILFVEQVKTAITEGVRCIDSMRGKYEHKRSLGGELYPIRSLYVTRQRSEVRIRVYLFRLCARLLNLLYCRIWFARIAPKLAIKPRPFRKVWIRTSGLV